MIKGLAIAVFQNDLVKPGSQSCVFGVIQNHRPKNVLRVKAMDKTQTRHTIVQWLPQFNVRDITLGRINVIYSNDKHGQNTSEP